MRDTWNTPRLAATTLALAAGLAACTTSTAPDKPAPKPLDLADSRIRFPIAGFDEAAATRRVVRTKLAREEYAFYRSPEGARAELILVQAPANRPAAIVRPERMRRIAGHLDGWRFNAGAISGMGETGEVGLGEATLYYRTYGHTLANRGCVALSSAWGRPANADRNAVRTWLIGYVCAPDGTAPSQAEAGQLVDSIRVRRGRQRWSTALTGKPAPALPDNAGHAGFPFGYGRNLASDAAADDGGLGGIFGGD
jgi:hypothetical protein